MCVARFVKNPLFPKSCLGPSYVTGLQEVPSTLKNMQTRSGRVLPELKVDPPPKEPIPKYSIRNPKYSHIALMTEEGDTRDIFEIILDKGVGDNKWPTELQARALSTDSLDYDEFTEHIRWLMSHMVEGLELKLMSRSKKTNRLVMMGMAYSLMNVAPDYYMRFKFRKLAVVCVEKMAEIDYEVTEFDLPRFIKVFKRSWRIV